MSLGNVAGAEPECFSCGEWNSGCEICTRIDENPEVVERGRSLTFKEIYGSFGDTIKTKKNRVDFDEAMRNRLDAEEVIDVDELIRRDNE